MDCLHAISLASSVWQGYIGRGHRRPTIVDGVDGGDARGEVQGSEYGEADSPCAGVSGGLDEERHVLQHAEAIVEGGHWCEG